MTELLLIDLSAIYVPIWCATPPDQPASAPHDITVRKVRAMASDAEHVAVSCDGRTTWRKAVYPDYKAQREARPAELFVQLARVKDTLRADGFAVLEADGFEADDIIATLTHQARDAGVLTIIATADKDLCQLVGPGVAVQPTRLGDDGRPLPVIGPAEVEARYGVPPEKLGDWLALTGDASDNVPGVPKVGPKTATGLLRDYGELEILLAAAKHGDPQMKPALTKLLVEHADKARLSRQLVTLRTDAPVTLADAMAPRVMQSLPRRDDDEWEGDEPEPDNDNDEETDMADMGIVTESEISGAPAAAAQPTTREAPAVVRELPAPAKADAIDKLAEFLPGTDAWASALEPRSDVSAWKIAGKLFDSRLFQFANIEQCFAAILFGRTLGLGAMTSCRSVHLVKGKMTLHVDLMVGLVKKSPLCHYWHVRETTADRCTIETHRRGDPEPTRLTFSIEDAIAAKLISREAIKGPTGGDQTWDKFRRQMVRHGCERELARMVYQDVVGGLYTPEDFAEIAEMPTRAA